MKNVLTFLLLFLAVSAFGQSGTIRGKVIEAATGWEVIGATVQVEGAATGTVTDIDGTFSLKADPGVHAVLISYVGYAAQKINEVEVKSGDVTVLGDIAMEEEAVTTETVVISARKIQTSESAMQTLQRKSIKTLDAISSQAFSLRGDNDAAAAVRRVPGVSVQEGKYVYIRGLGDRYSKTTLNGANIPGLDPDRNTVQMDLFPTNLLDNIVVYKNFTPDLPGDFTGGLVNVATKDFPEDFTMAASLGFGYNPQVTFNDNFLTSSGGKTDWLGYDDGARDFPAALSSMPTFGEALSNQALAKELNAATLSLNNELAPKTEAPLPNHNFAFSIGNQKTLFGKPVGFIGSLTYRREFSGYENGFTGRYTFAQVGADILTTQRELEDRRFSDYVIMGGMLNGSIKLNSFNKIGLNILRNQSGQTDTRFQEGRVSGGASDGLYQERTMAYQQRELTSFQLQGDHALGESQKFKVDWISSYTLSGMKQPDLRFVNNFFEAPDRYIIDPAEDIPPTRFRRTMDEVTFDNNLHLQYNFTNWTGQKGNIKVGGAYMARTREFRENTFRYENFESGNVRDFLNYVTPENAFSLENPGGIYISDYTEGRNQYDSDMSVLGAYAMTELPLTAKLKTILGARAEQTTLNFTSFSEVNPINDEALLDEWNYLPSAGLIYEAMPDKMNVRASYSRTVARPTFREIASIAIFDEIRNVIVLGNENLMITEVDNADFRWEYFFERGEMVSFSVFYKNFTNPIELTINPQTGGGTPEFQYRNVDQAILYGAEFEARKTLSFIGLPSFSIGTNLAFVNSEVDIPAAELQVIRAFDPNADATRPLFGQSPYIVNAYLNFLPESGRTKASLNFNVQGERLFLVSVGGTPDVYEQPFPSLNFRISQEVANNVNVTLGVGNILDPEFKRTHEFNGQEYFFRNYRNGRTISVGLSYKVQNY
ncbi:MAG: TonB-dependent receptor [Phaeodactylibacter sp.]|nr:TonB-dependent receptor [Phaeodactylibacter sp.]MCB9051836.1 TonB-dependent receptor [Lewinellaceae bacterium]